MMRPVAPVAACLLLAAVAAATTFRPATTADRIRAAERICCVVCESVEARLDERTGLVFTHVSLRLLEDLKGGGTGSSIALRLVGGEADGVRTVVPGMPRWRRGAECVVFLGPRNRRGHRVLHGAAHGVLPIEKDAGGRRRVGARLTGLGERTAPGRPALADFRAAVRRVLEEQRLEREAAREEGR